MSADTYQDEPADLAPRMQPDTLATSVAILLLVSVVQRSIGFGRGVFFCRWLAPSDLGEWDMANSFLLLAAPVVVLGLPGSFGRYLERYRQRNQLRTFLRRTAVWTTALVAAAVATLLLAAPSFSALVFGRPDRLTLIALMAASLAAIVFHHFLQALFAGLRKFRIVSTMQFCQSMAFAAISLSLLWWWRLGAESIVIGYGAACFLSGFAMLVWTGRSLVETAAPDAPPSHAEFWPPLVRFAIWIWITNLLCHLFAVVDRYMLVHWSGMDAATALAQVGNYHSSRVVPLLLLSIADLVSNVVMPYMSHDWERGNRREVSNRMNLVLKLAALGMFAAGVVVLWAAPLLFQFAFQGKYDGGLAVLPGTLTYCVWGGLAVIAQTYIWCAEKTKIGTIPLAIGLTLNIVLNLAMVPIWGLVGAVTATTISTAASLAVLYLLNRREGLELQPGLLVLSTAPIALCGGVWVATAVLVALLAAIPFSRTLVNDQQREVLAEFVREHVRMLRLYVAKPPKPMDA